MTGNPNLNGDIPLALPSNRRAGTLISVPYAGGPTTYADGISCRHCSYTSIFVVGSEKWWGYCVKCAGPICGRKCCLAAGCIPQEQWLENQEQGRPDDYRRVIAPVAVADFKNVPKAGAVIL